MAVEILVVVVVVVVSVVVEVIRFLLWSALVERLSGFGSAFLLKMLQPSLADLRMKLKKSRL